MYAKPDAKAFKKYLRHNGVDAGDYLKDVMSKLDALGVNQTEVAQSLGTTARSLRRIMAGEVERPKYVFIFTAQRLLAEASVER